MVLGTASERGSEWKKIFFIFQVLDGPTRCFLKNKFTESFAHKINERIRRY